MDDVSSPVDNMHLVRALGNRNRLIHSGLDLTWLELGEVLDGVTLLTVGISLDLVHHPHLGYREKAPHLKECARDAL